MQGKGIGVASVAAHGVRGTGGGSCGRFLLRVYKTVSPLDVAVGVLGMRVTLTSANTT